MEALSLIEIIIFGFIGTNVAIAGTFIVQRTFARTRDLTIEG